MYTLTFLLYTHNIYALSSLQYTLQSTVVDTISVNFLFG